MTMFIYVLKNRAVSRCVKIGVSEQPLFRAAMAIQTTNRQGS